MNQSHFLVGKHSDDLARTWKDDGLRERCVFGRGHDGDCSLVFVLVDSLKDELDVTTELLQGFELMGCRCWRLAGLLLAEELLLSSAIICWTFTY